MRFYLADSDHIEISRLNLLVAEFLRQTPFDADPGKSEAARNRLFSSPMQSHSLDAEFIEDWHDLIRPDLEAMFRTATETVARDLVGLREEKLETGESDQPSYHLRIPLAHLDAWLSCLNQARLVISEKFGFTEEDMDGRLERTLASKRDMALCQVHFYALIQELMLDVMRVQEGGPSRYLDDEDEAEEEYEDEEDDDFADSDLELDPDEGEEDERKDQER